MKNRIIFLWVGVAAISGFFLGMMQRGTSDSALPPPVLLKPEKAIISLEKILGDELFLTIEGNIRVLWGEDHFLDQTGSVFLGQIPDANDLQYREYSFVGNTNTQKFYPADSYWARGVRVSERRFFETKEAAIFAGFIPSKSVK